MPILDFSIDGIPLRSGPDVTLVILSAIGFPDDELARQAWLRAAVNARTKHQLASFPPTPGEMLPAVPAVHQRIVAAVASPSHDRDRDGAELGIDTRGIRGAAFILVRTLATPRGTVNDAIRAYIKGDGRRQGSVPGSSQETLKKAWRKNRPASHLMALWAFRPDVLRDDPRAALAWAESLRIAGEQYRPWRGREPLPDDKVTWKAPMSLGLHIVPRDQLGLPSDPKEITFDP